MMEEETEQRMELEGGADGREEGEACSSEVHGDTEKEKQEWARQMRLLFTPKDMITEDGYLKEDYFKPKKTKIVLKRWTAKERRLLLEGVEKYGIGEWAKIKEESLPEWSVLELRVKMSRLIGRQSLVQYKGWKGTEEDVRAEHEKNKALGLELGCWKGGVLVNDDGGQVLRALDGGEQKEEGEGEGAEGEANERKAEEEEDK
ncbi:HTH myb-type domain-containing protein [Balamuthia mandrillaris]